MKAGKVLKTVLFFVSCSIFISLYAQEVTCPERSYESMQHYLEPSPVGIDAKYAWTQPGGAGSFITVVDIVRAWNFVYNEILKNNGGVL